MMIACPHRVERFWSEVRYEAHVVVNKESQVISDDIAKELSLEAHTIHSDEPLSEDALRSATITVKLPQTVRHARCQPHAYRPVLRA